MKRLHIIILAVLALASCEQLRVDDVTETVEVVLSLNVDGQTKADSPLIPDVENLIYDVWILQYDKMGLLIDQGTSHQRSTYSGALLTTVTTDFAEGEDNTICVLANLDRGNPSAERTWPQTLNEFKTRCNIIDLSGDITKANNGTLEDMPMFGYWEGDITYKTNNVQVSLGRMLARVNLVINNNTSSARTITSVSKVPTKVYTFPNINHQALPEDGYLEALEINSSVAAGATKELYFYMAPNFTEGPANATKLNIEGKDPVILSNGAPSDNPRDYNLYHNSNYTFTININS